MKKYMIVDENGSILQDDFDTKDDAEFQSKEWANSEENYIGIDEPIDESEKQTIGIDDFFVGIFTLSCFFFPLSAVTEADKLVQNGLKNIGDAKKRTRR